MEAMRHCQATTLHPQPTQQCVGLNHCLQGICHPTSSTVSFGCGALQAAQQGALSVRLCHTHAALQSFLSEHSAMQFLVGHCSAGSSRHKDIQSRPPLSQAHWAPGANTMILHWARSVSPPSLLSKVFCVKSGHRSHCGDDHPVTCSYSILRQAFPIAAAMSGGLCVRGCSQVEACGLAAHALAS